MSADVFIDTNVFIYHLDATDKRKQAVADDLSIVDPFRRLA